MTGLELASKVSTSNAYFYGNKNSKYKVAVLDLGVKANILKNLANRNCFMKVFPHDSNFQDMLSWSPDAFFISNGPGDPEPLLNAINITKEIIASNIPLFGICLGHQILALALGANTFKMKFGHRGINQPVKNLITNKVEITSQNHGFAVDEDSLPSNVIVTHKHLNDDTVAGISCNDISAYSVQYHPEASPGPHDSRYVFKEFFNMMKNDAKT
jgi:carbamoyl-phosphate synthase small subunit